MGHWRSNEDEVQKISTSIFVTNFPNQFYAKDLWKLCNQYGNVVDAFIPYRRSKSGKRFGFVRFIKVFDVDLLVNNLCTIWVDRFKLHANKARFHRSPQNNTNPHYTNKGEKEFVPNVVNKDSGLSGCSNSYIHAVKRGTQPQIVVEENKPALVLDETCLNQEDLSTSLMGKVKEFCSLTNLKVVLDNEGFDNFKLKYMGGYWVMIVFDTEASKEKFKANVGIGSWFSQLHQASTSFHIDERVTWVDIEGIPLKVWTKNTFNRIASKCGDIVHVDDQDGTCFHSKRICIKTKLVENIFESFKIISNGKVFWVRAKEVSGWIPDFVDDEEEENDSDGETREDDLHDEKDLHDANAEKQEDVDVEGENDVDAEEVSETIFEKGLSQAQKKDDFIGQNDTHSEDPFNIYNLLNKKTRQHQWRLMLKRYHEISSRIHSHGYR
ncbi:hypothetical protein CTI12_AA244290 [Artemisia annua]|uniref:RRM domain-containing protein n=1 Tax=Artemisia annua TaxID=35608 RepID=A0A2U1NNC3_ARTAN|nr:hypothetical protein CTI12_AA244290 [Artemisia annua]